MLKPLRYFFLRVYEWKRQSEPSSLALFIALAATSAAVFLHVLALSVVLELVFRIDFGIPHDRNTARIVGVAAGLLIMGLLYRCWIANRSYLRFPDEFRDETPVQRSRRTVLIFVYVLVTYFLPFGLIIALRP